MPYPCFQQNDNITLEMDDLKSLRVIGFLQGRLSIYEVEGEKGWQGRK
jgi:hypothetical protein